MKKIILIVALLILFNVRVMTIRANELFGDGNLYYLRGGGVMIGYSDAWGHWFFYGRMDSRGEMPCTLTKLTSGGAGDADVVNCHIQWTKSTRFRGWIDFRGHTRPFCGDKNAEYPKKCRL